MLAKLLTEFALSEPAVVWSYYVSDTSSQVDCFHCSFLLFTALAPPLYEWSLSREPYCVLNFVCGHFSVLWAHFSWYKLSVLCVTWIPPLLASVHFASTSVYPHSQVDPTPAICSNCGEGLIKLITCNGIASCRVDKWRGGTFLDNSSISI